VQDLSSDRESRRDHYAHDKYSKQGSPAPPITFATCVAHNLHSPPSMNRPERLSDSILTRTEYPSNNLLLYYLFL
jgi:hypothetical protein